MKEDDIKKIQALMAEHDITDVEFFVAWVKRLLYFAEGVKEYVELLDDNGDLD